MRRILSLATLLVFSCFFSLAQPAERPNVIIVLGDDMGYGELSCHGNPVVRTPNLDELHAQSVRLVDFHVTPMCTPTRGQLMSGIDALRNKAMNVSSGRTLLRRELPTMADVFAASGYRTGIFGKWHLGDNYPYRPQDRGFDEAIWFPSSHIGSVPDFWNNDYFDDTFYHGDERQTYKGYCTDVFFREAIEWMSMQASQDRPFFTYLPLNAAHGPLWVPEEYRGPVRKSLREALPKLPKLNEGQQERLVSYLAMIENLDENFGRLESFLRERGLRENTIVIFLTDNGSTMGPMYYNAGMRGGKVTLWEGGHRVPCFIRWPAGDLRRPGDLDGLTEVQDLLPTLIDLCDIKKPANARFDGISLADYLRGQTDQLPDRTLVIHYCRMPFNTNRNVPRSRAIVERDGAVVLWRRWRLLRGKRLYNLETDPRQQRNVIEEFPKVAARMRDYYGQWWEGVKDDVNVPERIVIGHAAANSVMLTCCDWFNVFVDQQRQVRRGVGRSGPWFLEVAQEGDYVFELCRWPREAKTPLRSGLPEKIVTDGVYPAGVALPIAKARMQIGGETQTTKVAADDFAATFQVHLPAGPTKLQTGFLNAEGKELCGAYYVYVERK